MRRSPTRRVKSTGRSMAAALVAAALATGSAGAQVDTITESVDVRVVNVDVIATDKQGTIIRGLEREDFELVVNGEPVPIEYFSAVETDSFEGLEATAGMPPEAQSLPLLIINYDARQFRPGEAAESMATLRERLDEILLSTRAIMVTRQGMSLVVEQPFTRDRELLDAAFDRLGEMYVPVRSTAGRKLLVSRLERATDPALAGVSEEDEGVLDEALMFLTELRSQTQLDRSIQEGALEQLQSLIGSVAGLPGRKAILYIGPGVEPQPNEALYRLWWSKYQSVASQINVNTIESEMGLEITTKTMTDLLDRANAAQVAFYGFDPRGVRAANSVEFESVAAVEFSETDARAAQQWILTLARGSGGEGRINSADLGGLLGEMNDSFKNYYSLGFSPEEGFPEKGRVHVRLANHKGRVRHFDRYLTRTGTRELHELTLAALLTEMAVNPMEIQVEVDEPERQADGNFVVPLMVKIPIAALTLVPRGDQHVGKLSVVVQAQGEAGEISDPAEGVVPIELDNENLLTSLGAMAGYRLRMRVSPGEQKIAIGVRDEIAQLDSALRMVIQAGRGS